MSSMSSNVSSAAASTAGSAVYIIVQPTKTSDRDHFAKNFPSRIVSALSAGQLFIFATALVASIILIVHDEFISYIGSGIWCGIFFGIAGTLGLLASWKPTNCSIISFMVLNILAVCFTIPLIVFSGIGIGNSKRLSYYGRVKDEEVASHSIAVVFHGILFFCGLVEVVIAVACGVISCRATCCRSRKTTGAVVYAPAASVSRQGEGGHPQPPVVPPGAFAIPFSSIAEVAAASNSSSNNAAVSGDHPPKYEEAASASGAADEVPEEGERYQRFA